MSVCLQFTGDILCQMPQTEACKTADGYHYRPIFAPIRPLLLDCDYLVGNLETPLAGEAMGYSDRLYQFNTPSEFVDLLTDSEFDLVSTANNHCMDRGVEGLFATLKRLDEAGIAHIGTYRSPQERSTPFIRSIGNIRFGFLSYTYGTNAFFHHIYLPQEQKWAVNLLQPEEERCGAINLLDQPDSIANQVQTMYEADSPVFREYIGPYLEQLKQDITSLHNAGAEYIIMLLHCGGQHLLKPDPYTEWVVSYLKRAGVDLVVGNHQHILHPYVHEKDFRVAYCLGNLTDTPDSNPNGRGIGEEYSVLLRMKFEKTTGCVQVSGASFIPVKSVFDPQGRAVVDEVYALIEHAQGDEQKQLIADHRHFVNLVRGTPEGTPVELRREYDLE